MRAPAGEGPGRVAGEAAAPRWAAGLIVAVGLATYANSFSGPFVFDDGMSILGNPTILHLTRWHDVFRPPSVNAATVGGRPLLNFSLALNHAVSGTAVWSYHALNLIIHILAALTLFGLIRTTLRSWRPSSGRSWSEAELLRAALAVALVWLVHPLQTEAVTYVIQRAESLMGLFYLLTLYAFARATVPGGRAGWLAVSWIVCLAGMVTKEVMVSAPVIVFLYDRAFVGGSVRAAWQRRWRYYLALALTWLPLAWLVIQTGGNRGGSTGVGTGVSWLHYVASQFPALVHYLRLVVWPRPLIFYYPVYWPSWGEAAPAIAAVTLLAAGTAYALGRNRALGFLAIWFFAVLAPTSLVPGAYQAAAEHRMYLALAPVVAAVVLALLQIGGSRPWLGRLVCGGLAAATAVLALSTRARNQDYRSELSIWAATAKNSPDNMLAQCGVGIAYAKMGQPAAAEAQFEKILRRFPTYPYALVDLGNLRRAQGRRTEAIADYQRALEEKPDWPEAMVDLANVLIEEGRVSEAVALSERAVQDWPLYAEAYVSLGLGLAQAGDRAGAIRSLRRARELKPDSPEADYDLANVLGAAGRDREAIECYQEALRLNPAFAEAHDGLGLAWTKVGQVEAAEAEYRRALAAKPDFAEAEYNLGNLLAQNGQPEGAQRAYRAALRIRPDFFQAKANLANTLLSGGHPADAIPLYNEVLQLHPEYVDAHYNLALALQAVGRSDEAEGQRRAAARLQGPNP